MHFESNMCAKILESSHKWNFHNHVQYEIPTKFLNIHWHPQTLDPSITKTIIFSSEQNFIDAFPQKKKKNFIDA